VLLRQSSSRRDSLEHCAIEGDVDDDSPDDAVSGDDVDRALHDPGVSGRTLPARQELHVGVGPAQALECRVISVAQRPLHVSQRGQLDCMELRLVDDAAVLARRRAERRIETSVGARPLVVGGVVPERPRRRDQRQDEQDDRAGEPQT
jgi:hypothetical protein